MTVKVITNNVSRPIIDGYQLTADERAEFDYLNWEAIDEGRDSADFFRYRGSLYDLGEFTADYGITKGAGLPYLRWDGYMSTSAFSAVVVRYDDNYDRVTVGLVLS
jgi:hypothetical protein